MGWVFNHKKKPGCPCKFFATENKEQNERESVFAAQYSALWVEGGSKQNGVRMHATDYENYVSKYLMQ